MFERFTDRARRIVVIAQEQARLLNHNYIGTEHLLLGLIAEDEGVAAQVLKGFGLELEKIRAQVEEQVGSGTVGPRGHIPFTPRAKKVIELSLREALQMGHNYIGTEHLLLGLIREGEGVGAQVLTQLNKLDDLNKVRQAVITKLSGQRHDDAFLEARDRFLETLADAKAKGLDDDAFPAELTRLTVGEAGPEAVTFVSFRHEPEAGPVRRSWRPQLALTITDVVEESLTVEVERNAETGFLSVRVLDHLGSTLATGSGAV